jgi:hypothetical protein
MNPASIAPASAFIVIGAGMAFQQGIPASRALRSRHWPRVTGRITTSRAIEVSGPRGSLALTPSIRYEYSVNGRTYESNTVTYGSFSRPLTEDLLSEFPTGATVNVSYDPSAPSHAVLRPGVDSAEIFFTALGLAVLAYGARMLLIALR